MFIFIVTVNCVTLCCMEFGVIVLQMSAIIAIEYKDSLKIIHRIMHVKS